MIVAAAIRRQGLVFTLPRPARHHDVMRAMFAQGVPAAGDGVDQGFLTDEGMFLRRAAALGHAIEADQVKVDSDGRPKILGGELTSEDLW